MNVVVLSGNVSNVSEVRKINDSSVLNFTVATNEFFGGKKQAQFHRCAVWGKLADSMSSILEVGTKVSLTGSLNHSSKKRDDGTYDNFTQINVNKLDLMGGKGDRGDAHNAGGTGRASERDEDTLF